VLRPLSPAIVAAALIALAGCQNRPASEEDKQARKAFVSDMQHVLKLGIATADTGKQVGVVMLNVKLDQHSAPISCKTSKAPMKYERALPADLVRSDFNALANMVEAQCWKTIYPVVPKSMRDEDGTLVFLTEQMI